MRSHSVVSLMTGRVALALIAGLLLGACAGGGPASQATPSISSAPSGSPTPDDCASRIASRLTVPQQVGQLLFLGLAGNSLGPAERTAIKTYDVGSVWFTELSSAPSGSVAAVGASVQALAASASGIGFLVGANQEGGQIDQFHGPGFDPIPSALQQGSEDPAALRSRAAVWGAQLTAAGINLDLAPVMDTVPPGQDQNNPPIGALQREFGHDPDTVTAHGLAFIAGMHEAKVLVTLKHFPGLGRVSVNTDFGAAAVDRTTTAHDPYLAPFRQGIGAGADLVMVSTATYTMIDPQHLAVFSPKVIGLLRDSMGFSGVVVSDDLGAAVAVASIPPGDRAVDFVAAGGDLVTVKTADLVAPMAAALTARDLSDPAFAAQVRDAVNRVLRLKVHAGLAACAS